MTANSTGTEICCECKICKESFPVYDIHDTRHIFPICDGCLKTLKVIVENEKEKEKICRDILMRKQKRWKNE